MKKLFSIIAFLSLLLVISGCGLPLKYAIHKYKGDGEIQYLEAPGLLGASGCSIKMPSFNLSKDFEKTYSLAGIPANENYVVYLVVKDPANIGLIKQSFFSYKIREGERIIKDISLPLRDFTVEQGGCFNKFYYFNRKLYQDSGIHTSLGGSDLPTTIEITYLNKALASNQDGYLEIRFGGFK